MIIQIRGTSGSGKTWVMQQLIKRLHPLKPHFVTGRKKPLFYVNNASVAILGHYDTACGGCDNVGSAAAVAQLIQDLQQGVHSVVPKVIICEGLLLSEDTKWTSQMDDVRIVYLVTTIETCIVQITNRRLEAGNEKPLNEQNTRKRVTVIERSRIKLLDKGITCRRCISAQAPELIMKWINDAKA